MTNHTPSISVVLPCLFPDTKPIWMMMESCEKFGIVPVLYGMGGVFNGWVDIKIVRFFEALKQTVTDLVLYSDARDAFFLRGLPDIIATYGGLGSPPILMGTQDCYFTDHPDWFDAMPNPPDKVFRYIGLSTFMGQRDALLSAFTTISRYKGLPQDDPPWWNRFIREGGQVEFDYDCCVFQNAGLGAWDKYMELRDGQPYNTVTDTHPCLLHFNNGYTDPVTGKWYIMKDAWEGVMR